MTEDRALIELVDAFDVMFQGILDLAKSLANAKRLRILIALLTGEKSFDYLKTEVNLEKSALANHLVKLKKSGLLEKPEHGTYQITQDGKLFLRALERIYRESDIWEKKGIDMIESRQFSESFVKSFFG